jgi:hypothetical protein
LKIVSTIVMGYVIHMRIAGFTALTTRPGGNTMSSARNWPSLIGRSRAEEALERHLATGIARGDAGVVEALHPFDTSERSTVMRSPPR